MYDDYTTEPLAPRLVRLTRPAERRVAEYLIEAGAKAAPLSAQEIAAAVGTSDATVVRAAKSLGYPNLRELRRALTDDRDDADLSARLQATIGASSSPHDVLAAAAERQVKALNTLLRQVSIEEFDEAASLLARARQVWWCGTGPSAHLAGYAAFLCRRLGRASGALTHAGTDHADELLAVQPGDAVVVLAYGRVHPYVHVLLERTERLAVPAVLITDATRRPLNSSVAVQLHAGRGAPGFFATHGPTIVLLEALVLALAASDAKRAEEALATLNQLRRAIAGKRLDVDPD